jgi:acyl carrier protein
MNKLDQLVHTREAKLRNGPKTFVNIYTVMFSDPSFIMCERTDGYRVERLSYGEMDARIRSTAYSLSGVLGAGRKGSFVGLEMENSPEWIISFWALLMSGYKPLLVNDRLPRPLIDQMLSDTGAAAVLSLRPVTTPVENVLFSSLTDAAPKDYCGSWADALAVCTSATSLHLKVCVYTGEEISWRILNTMPILDQSPAMKAHCHGSLKQLAFLPFFHVFGLIATFFWFAYFGRTFVFLKDYSGDTILRTCRKHEVTHIFAVPLLWHSIAREVMKEVAAKGARTERKFRRALALSTALQNFSPRLGKAVARGLFRQVRSKLFGDSIRFLISGGSYLQEDTLRLFNGLGYPLHVGYGMSEIGITSVELREDAKSRNSNSIGRPFRSVEYRIVGGGSEGELAVRGKSLYHALYLDGTCSLRTDEWFLTGDLVRADAKGNYYFVGRKSDTVIGANGENVNPDTVEAMLRLDYCRNYCVLGLPQDGGEALCLVVQLSPSLPGVSRQRLCDSIRTQAALLPQGERLARVCFTEDAIASEGAIKVSRAFLRQQVVSGAVRLQDYRSFRPASEAPGGPEDDTLRIVRGLFAQVLGKTPAEIGPDDHFIFDLGGSSLDYFSLLSALSERFGIKLQTDAENYCNTAREFAQAIEKML